MSELARTALAWLRHMRRMRLADRGEGWVRAEESFRRRLLDLLADGPDMPVQAVRLGAMERRLADRRERRLRGRLAV